jgi:capsular polysaccharide export protein
MLKVSRRRMLQPVPALTHAPEDWRARLQPRPGQGWVNPFSGAPMSPAEAEALLDLWHDRAAENARVAVLFGMDGWKQASIQTAFARPGGPPTFAATAEAALAIARPDGGAIAAWATRLPKGFAARCAAAGVPLLHVEDGFLRSVGLGVNFVTAASLCVDPYVPHYDPSAPSLLERTLSGADFPPDLLERAAALRARIVAMGVTKYNLGGGAPTRGLAAALAKAGGRRRILVPGQVEDDASVRLGGAGTRRNLDLLRAVRAANPEAWIAYRPHPDVQTGYRRGYVTRREALEQADAFLPEGDITGLFAQVEEVHTITSLAGFEALLRGLSVTTHGQPFYAGWGLTTDLKPPPRRGRTLTLDALVAGALLLYPRYTDPVTGLPCPPETLLDRLAERANWPRLPTGRRLYDRLWWRPQGWLLKQARHFGLWQR